MPRGRVKVKKTPLDILLWPDDLIPITPFPRMETGLIASLVVVTLPISGAVAMSVVAKKTATTLRATIPAATSDVAEKAVKRYKKWRYKCPDPNCHTNNGDERAPQT